VNPELTRLADIADQSLYAAGANASTVRYSFEIFARYLRGDSILELGAAEGVMTELLAGTGKALTVVEGSSRFCESLRTRFPAASIRHSLFEDYEPASSFDNIILGHVLEHVLDPVGILARAHRWLSKDGRIMAAVPNSRSLHRQAAVLMGLLPFEESLNEADMHHGHRRVFNPETFRRCFGEAGFATEIFGGYWLKPVSNKQIETSWNPEMLNAFMKLGERYPDIAGEIYVIARLP
jgi:2-polyprenyl-3-methyl-5-hydroxy-6-metoxy-1,4-benzoquinol methylase